jgi:hypothetical protein
VPVVDRYTEKLGFDVKEDETIMDGSAPKRCSRTTPATGFRWSSAPAARALGKSPEKCLGA